MLLIVLSGFFCENFGCFRVQNDWKTQKTVIVHDFGGLWKMPKIENSRKTRSISLHHRYAKKFWRHIDVTRWFFLKIFFRKTFSKNDSSLVRKIDGPTLNLKSQMIESNNFSEILIYQECEWFCKLIVPKCWHRHLNCARLGKKWHRFQIYIRIQTLINCIFTQTLPRKIPHPTKEKQSRTKFMLNMWRLT